jgi:hypothetical protein
LDCYISDRPEGDKPSPTNYELPHMLSFQHLTKSPFQALEQTPVKKEHVITQNYSILSKSTTLG